LQLPPPQRTARLPDHAQVDVAADRVDIQGTLEALPGGVQSFVAQAHSSWATADDSRHRVNSPSNLIRSLNREFQVRTIKICMLAVGFFCSLGVVTSAGKDNPITEFPLPTEGHWCQGIVAGPDGNMWVTESKKHVIIRITPEGKTDEWVVPGAELLQGITVGADGNLWFTSPSDNTIRRISPKGELNGKFTIPTVVNNKLKSSFPRGIATGPDGNVWFAELYGNKIGRITPKGDITEFPVPTPESGPYAPAFDKNGKVWFCESTAHKVARLDPATGKVDEFPVPTAKCLPRDMITGPDGNLWFSENQADKIGRITLTGDVKEFPLPSGSRPVGLAVGQDGNIWFSGFGNSKIGRLKLDGKVTMFDIPTPKAQPFGLAAGPDSTIWFAAQSNRIGRLNVKAAGE
jgi:virginiamycin B lyase